MEKDFGLKELYDLTLKATYPIEIGNRIIEPGEVVARFDKVSLANFREITERVSARGGVGNTKRIFWEDPQEIRLSFTQGVFSKVQFALMSNSSLLSTASQEPILVPERYVGESDENGKIVLRREAVSSVFVYNADTYERIVQAEIDQAKGEISIEKPYQNVMVDYEYNYTNGSSQVFVGEKLIKGYLCLEGKTRIRDDITGETHTAILRVPRLKLVSDLVMCLGRDAHPMVASFDALGLPTGQKGNRKIMELLFLNDDIDTEM